MTTEPTVAPDAGRDATAWPEGHEEEQGDEPGQVSWCSSDEHDGEVHDGVEQYPQWPCAVVLAHTGDADAGAYWKREGDAWCAWYRQQRRTSDRRQVQRNWPWVRRSLPSPPARETTP